MKQLIQNFKTGQLAIENVPTPALFEGSVLVKNEFSLISAGTERATVSAGKQPLAARAKSRPDLVKQVMANIKKEGLFLTMKKVQTKLDTPKALGYSCCGVVMDSKDFEGKFRSGDRVACAGQDYASHAQVVCVPQNLVVKIPDEVSMPEAAFTTIGAIALQGIRQADVKIGENICVLGLGLIGQMTAQILKANGCRVCGIDMSDDMLALAQNNNIDGVINRKDENIYLYLENFTAGAGFDSVIITASSPTNDPVVLATECVRQKGTIVVVGDVQMNIPRNPHFYRKELQLKMATSYGPGRYDSLYEEAGVDYPYGYVRFTENRNMETFLGLVAAGKINVKNLITQVFDFNDALKAYDIITGKKKEFSVGVLLQYGAREEGRQSVVSVAKRPLRDINIGFIGAGSFAQGYLLPNLPQLLSRDTVVTTRGISAKNAAKKFLFNSAATDASAVLENEDINTVFIATRHDSHGRFVLDALKKGKHIFVEKPLAITKEDLKQIAEDYKGQSILAVGFNRRFAPVSRLIKKELKKTSGPIIVTVRVNAGVIDNNHWIHNPDIGGGRIIGEGCHFIDLMSYFCDSIPSSVCATLLNPTNAVWRGDDNLSIAIEFENGSVGTLIYTAMGSSALEKEHIEIFANGDSYILRDFKSISVYKNQKKKVFSMPGKGHKEEMEAFISAIREGKDNPIPFESLLATTLTTFKIKKSILTGNKQKVDLHEIHS